MGPEPLYHDLPGLAIDAVRFGHGGLVLAARPTARTVPCPACGRPSDTVHSRYARTPADRPWLGLRIRWRVAARRFACRHAGCPRRVFCERLPAAGAHARSSARLAADHTAPGLAAGGEGGSRLAARLGMPASPDTLLRRVRSAALPVHPAARGWGWTTGPGGRGAGTGPSWWTWSGGPSSTCSRTGRPTGWPPGCGPTPGSRWWPGTGPTCTPGGRPPGPRRRCRWPTGGTC